MNASTLRRASAARHAMLIRGKKPLSHRQLAESIQQNLDAMRASVLRIKRHLAAPPAPYSAPVRVSVRPLDLEDQARAMVAAGLY